jgi:hypothetical protein
MPVIQYDLKGDSADFTSGIMGAQGAMLGATKAAGALAAGVLALGASVGALIDDVTTTVDQVNTLAAATGLSTESINGLRLAAKASGKELTDIVPQKLAKNMLAAADSGGAMADAFGRVGVEFKNTDGSLRDANELFPELIDGLAGMENRTEAAAVASQLLGKNGKELLTAFSDSAGFEHFVLLGQEFGIRTGPDAVKATADWQQATSNLSLAFENAGQRFLDTIGGPSLVAGFVENFALGFVAISEFAAAWSSEVVDAVMDVGEVFDALASGDIAAARDAVAGMETPFERLGKATDQALDRAESFFETAQQGATDAGAAIEDDVVGPMAQLADLAKDAEAAFVALAQAESNLSSISKARQSDLMDAEAQALDQFNSVNRAIEEEIARLEDLRETGLDVSAALAEADSARAENLARINRELTDFEAEEQALRLEQLEEAKELEAEVWQAAQDGIAKEAADLTSKLAAEDAARQLSAQLAAESAFEVTRLLSALTIQQTQDEAAALQDKLAVLDEQIRVYEETGDARLEGAEAERDATQSELDGMQDKIRRAFAASQAAAIAGIAINAAASILALIPSFAALSAGAPLAATAVVAPVAAAQIAIVASQKAPTVHDGTANTDEVMGLLRSNEAVLNQRGAEQIGRQAIDGANRGTMGGGGPRISQIVFNRRVLDTMVSSTVQAGGKTANLIGRGRAPTGTADPYGGV